MDDNSKSINGQSEVNGKDNGNADSEAGKTYWEAENVSQAEGRSEKSGQETADQFYTNYRTQMSRDTEAGLYQQGQSRLEPPRKKSRKKLLAAIIAIAILACAGTVAFAFQNELKNTLAMITKSPEEYYAYVENNYMGNLADDVVSNMEKYRLDDNMDAAYRLSMDLSYDKDTVSSLIQPYLGASIGDLESMIGLPLDSIGMDMTVASEDVRLYDELNLRLNKTSLITAQFFMDNAEGEMLIGLPELTLAYLKIDTDEYASERFDYGEYSAQTDMIKSEKTADLIKRYTAIITSQLKDVELKKNAELKVGKASVKSSLLTVTIDHDTAMDITEAVLDEAYDDEYLLELLPLFDMTEDEYREALEEAREDLRNRIGDDYEDDAVIMKIYVDSKGKILGRELEFTTQDDTEAKLTFFNITKAKEDYYEFIVEDSSGNKLISAEGSHVRSDGAYTGEADIDLYDYEGGYISFNVEYEDVKKEKPDGRTLVYGTFSIITPKLPGTEILLEINAEDEVQKADLYFNMGSTSLVTLNVTTERLKDYELPLPDGSAAVYRAEESESFISSFDVEGFINTLSDKLGTDIQYILDLFRFAY